MNTLWLVRHGPTHEKAFTGWRDVPADLSDHDRIARLDAYLPQNALLISSDLRRAIDTASQLENGRRRLRSSPQLREFDFGAWDGMRFDEVAARDPDLSRQFWEQPGHICPPYGESWHDVAHRAAGELGRVLRENPGQDIVIVAHFGVILTQIARASGQQPTDAMAQKIDNLSVSQIHIRNDIWTQGEVNVCP